MAHCHTGELAVDMYLPEPNSIGEETSMIEVTNTYDLQLGVNLESYAEWARKAAETIVQQPGLVELRANRNMLGAPQFWRASRKPMGFWSSEAQWSPATGRAISP